MANIFSGDFWTGSNDRFKKLSTKTKLQQKKLEDYLKKGIETSPLYGAGSDYLQSLLGGGPNAFSQFEAPYMQQYQQETIPGIAQQFAGAGTGAGASSSSALNQSLAQAGAGLQNNLASLHGNLRMQALPQALGYAQQPFTNQLAGIAQNTFENTYQPGSQGFLGEVLTSAAKQGTKSLFGGGMPQAGMPGGIG